MKNQLRLSFSSLSVNEGFARVAVAAFVSALNPTIEEINDIKTAVSEAVTNCIVHAYGDTVGPVTITVKLQDQTVRITVKDQGCGIPDVARAMEPLFTTGGEERAGLGFAVMESFTDGLSVRSKVGKGTTVIMKKKIRARYGA